MADSIDDEVVFDVAVVGYGPTGMVAASTLAQAGLRVAVVERFPTSYGLPRLSHIDGETARIVQACGDVDVALRDAAAIDDYDYRNGDGELLIRLDWSGEACGFPAHTSMFQPDIEDAIDAAIAEVPNVEFLKGWEVTALEQDGKAATLSLRCRNEGQEGTTGEVRARYVVAADGAKSFIREALGIGRSDIGYNERWLNLDSEILRPLHERFSIMAIFCDPKRAHMMMPIGKSRIRFEVRLLPREDSADWSSLEAGWRWLEHQHDLRPEDLRPLRNVIYTFETRMAERWSEGRVFLAGDAAHTMMPYMGQGACSGMRDGINVGWKLALVAAGKADRALLDTYEDERRPHVQAITDMSTFLGQVANEDDPAKVAARDEAFRTRNVPPMPPFPHVTGGVTSSAPDAAGIVGRPAPQGRGSMAGRSGRMNDLLGRGFYVVAESDPRAHLSEKHRRFLDDLGCHWAIVGSQDEDGYVEDDGMQHDYFAQHGIAAYFVRPDFLVFGAVTANDDLGGLVDELRTRLHWRAG